MDYRQLEKKITSGALPPVLYLYGEEGYLLRQSLQLLKKTVVPKAADFNLGTFDLREDGVERALSAARTSPMMAPRRVVIGLRADELKGDALAPLLTYIQAPSNLTVLVLVGKTLDARTKFAQLLSAQEAVCQFKTLRRAELESFVTHAARAQNLRCEPGVFDELFSAYGLDLAQWMLALDRLALFALPPPTPGSSPPSGSNAVVPAPITLTVEMALSLSQRTRPESVFALTDALLAGRLGEALAYSQQLLDQKEAPLGMLALVARNIRQLMIVKDALDRGVKASEAVREAAIPPFVAETYVARARATTLLALKRVLLRLTDTDVRLKSSRVPDQLIWFQSLWQSLTDLQATNPRE